MLGDFPVIKPLFRSSLTTKKKTELLFFVSPTVITPDALAPMAREERYGIGKRYTEERQKREFSIFEVMQKEQQKLLEPQMRLDAMDRSLEKREQTPPTVDRPRRP